MRSVTQPLGSPTPLDSARLSARLTEVGSGLAKLADGGRQLHDAFVPKATALRLQGELGRLQGFVRENNPAARDREAALREDILKELTRAAEQVERIAEGGRRARAAIDAMLEDPLGLEVLDRLLVTREYIRARWELRQSIAVYISPDGRATRFELTQTDPVFSAGAIETVDRLRERLDAFLAGEPAVHAGARVAGTNAEGADIRAQSRDDLWRLYFLVPLGIFLVLVAALRDALSCLNLVATMLLTHLFALGVTHAVFVRGLGAEGLDWKVPYFLLILLVAGGVDYNILLISRLREEAAHGGLRAGVQRAIGQTGGLITAAAITACSFAAFLSSPLWSIRQLGLALVVRITVDAALVRPVLVPCGHWLLNRHRGEGLGDRAEREPGRRRVGDQMLGAGEALAIAEEGPALLGDEDRAAEVVHSDAGVQVLLEPGRQVLGPRRDGEAEGLQ